MISSKHLPLAALTAVLLTAVPSLAFVQIYTWRDAAGNLVLSNTPRIGAAQTFAVAGESSIRTTRRALSSRAAAFDALIVEQARASGVSADLVRAVIQAESAFNPHARSHKGAMGLMQLMPATAAEYNVRDPYDPRENVRAGVAYLKRLLTRYDNDVELALAAYNAGPGAVKKYGAVPPYRETREYIARIKATGPVRSSTTRVFRTVEIVDGREVTRLSNTPPVRPAVTRSGTN